MSRLVSLYAVTATLLIKQVYLASTDLLLEGSLRYERCPLLNDIHYDPIHSAMECAWLLDEILAPAVQRHKSVDASLMVSE